MECQCITEATVENYSMRQGTNSSLCSSLLALISDLPLIGRVCYPSTSIRYLLTLFDGIIDLAKITIGQGSSF